LPPILKETREIHAIVETPKGSRNKFHFDIEIGLSDWAWLCEWGLSFLSNLVSSQELLASTGILWTDSDGYSDLCWMRRRGARLIGVIEPKQRKKDGKEERNDRLIAVALEVAPPSERSIPERAARRVASGNRALFHLAQPS
jgi:inorganic pyrophosphatase